MNTLRASTPMGPSLPWCIRDQGKCVVGNWNIQGGKVLTLLHKDIFKWYHNISYMKEQRVELCSLIQSPDHLLKKESRLMDICLEWGWGRSGERNCVCKGRVALWLCQEMLIRKSDSRKGFTAFLETQKCD